MADGKEKESSGPERPRLQEDPIVARLVSGDQAPTGLTSYVGLLSRSPTEGRWRLYLSLDMSVYVEVREEDIVQSEQLASDKSPFGGLGGTQIYVKKGAEVTTTQIVSRTLAAGGADDEFDLDIRLGAPVSLTAPVIGVVTGIGVGGTCETCRTQCDTCPGDTCVTCQTCRTRCGHGTCHTCHTQCGTCLTCQTCQTQCGTCVTCQTCQTHCGQATCVTCGQATCQTCQTHCGQATCVTCRTCQTCRTDCNTCPGETCVACTHATCFRGCGDTGAVPC